MEDEYGYMEEEEEWDREGLLDPAWEKQQKKISLGLDIYIQTVSTEEAVAGAIVARSFDRLPNMDEALSGRGYCVCWLMS
ncbi:alpha actinin [Elysia marginata]|uniref:Alpha actinin n=1 Tax=Elysia marginata TaxID=1093978 RepID=A0AAV4ENW8_9GAST|nr:alpha actinin [Elysia marginata]